LTHSCISPATLLPHHQARRPPTSTITTRGHALEPTTTYLQHTVLTSFTVQYKYSISKSSAVEHLNLMERERNINRGMPTKPAQAQVLQVLCDDFKVRVLNLGYRSQWLLCHSLHSYLWLHDVDLCEESYACLCLLWVDLKLSDSNNKSK
jgi:hypothetical protein